MNLNCIPNPSQRAGEAKGGHSFGCGCLGLAGSLICLGGLLVLALAVFTLAGAIGGSFEGSLSASGQTDETYENKVLRLEIMGPIMFDDQRKSFLRSSDSDAQSIIDDIAQAASDEDVRGILLVVDSPGGEITACDLIHRELMKFRNSDSNRVIVAYFRGTAASGGYYVSMPANKIVAGPTAITGSIGVMMQGLNFAKAAEKLGIGDMTFASGPMKDMLNPMHGVSPAVSNLVQSVIGDLHSHFKGIVAKGRNLPAEKVDLLSDGRIYTAKQALEAGLIDAIGYEEDAETALEELGIEDYGIVQYEEKGNFLDRIMSEISLKNLNPIKAGLNEAGFSLRYEAPLK